MAIWGDFQGLTGATGGGRVVKNRGKWGDVVYGWSLKGKLNYGMDFTVKFQGFQILECEFGK